MSRFRDDRKQPGPSEAPVKTQAEIDAKKAELKKTTVEKEAEAVSKDGDVIKRTHAKNGTAKVWVKDNIDPTQEKRKRNKHGTAINFPLFVEEYLTIETAYEIALKAGETESFADYIREVLKEHAKEKLGAKAYKEILDKKYNQEIVKKDKTVISE